VFTSAQPMCIDVAKTYIATVETTKGTFEITFDAKRAPNTVNNFVTLARWKYFDGIGFHRVVPGFVIQGGDPEGTGGGGPGYDFADELPQAGEYKIGSLAMANAGPNTNGSQFFVITGEQGAGLPPSYSLFGEVTKGIETVTAIDALGVGDGPPSEPVTMTKVTITDS
jgi:cyclophilin family peptidyl-prolyl cis-trans isomerase